MHKITKIFLYINMIIEKLQQPEVHLQCDDLTPNQKKLLAEVMLRHEMKWGLAYNRFFRFGFKEWELKGIDQIKRDFLSQHQEEIFPPNLDMSQPTSDDMVSGKGVFYRMLGMTIGMKKLFMEHMNNKYSKDGYLKLWIPGSPNAKKLSELQARLDEMEKKDAQSKMAASARKLLQDENIVVDDVIVSALIREDAEHTKAAVDAFIKSFKSAVQNAAKMTFGRKEKPKTGGNGGEMTRSDIMKIADRAERQKAIKAHPELFR